MASQDTTRGDPRADTTGSTVLFVDDEPELLDLYEAFCDPEYTTRTATSGEKALEAFGPDVDLMFVDRRMPGLSGEAVVEEIREQGYQTPVVFISAVDPDASPSVDHEAYLTKPVSREQIRANTAQQLE
jgi:CheY-like chemotaxis protein